MGPGALELSCMMKYMTDDSNIHGFTLHAPARRHRWLQICVVYRSCLSCFPSGARHTHAHAHNIRTSGACSDAQRTDRIKGRPDAWYETAWCGQGLADREHWIRRCEAISGWAFVPGRLVMVCCLSDLGRLINVVHDEGICDS